jgi:hypothetical protein
MAMSIDAPISYDNDLSLHRLERVDEAEKYSIASPVLK